MSGGTATWITPMSSVYSFNGAMGSVQNFATSTSGIDFSIVTVGNTHTFRIPDASTVARGFVSTGSQSFEGTKIFSQAPVFSKAPVFSTMLNGSIFFAGSGGTVSQDNSSFFWDDTSKYLGIGTNTPKATLHNNGSTIFGSMDIGNLASGGNIGTAATTVDIKTNFNVNQTTANQTIALPDPTDATAGRIAYVTNIGTKPFTIYATQLIPNSARSLIWNGSSWVLAGNADDKTVGLIRKTADESVVSSTTVQNDDHLFFPVKANETWMFQITGIVRNGNTGTMKVKMDVAGATNCSNTVSTNYQGAWATNSTCNSALNIPNLQNGTTSNSDSFIYIGVFQVGGSDTTAQLQWAQASSNPAATILLKDSTITYTRLSGADVAEVYYTNDQSAENGDIVSLNGEGISQVSKSTTSYDARALGIISTKPGLTLGAADGNGRPVVVGLSGRVPVKISTQNGDIKPGDYITTSDIPGVGMKATEAGRVIGKALTGLSGVETGLVGVFIQNTYYDGVDETEYNSFVSNSQSGALLGNLVSPLDRFSFMVNKSLAKIDPTFGSGASLSGFSLAVTTLANRFDTLSGTLNTVFDQFTSLSGTIVAMQARIDTI